MKYSRRGFVTSTGPNFRASKVQPALASTPSFSSSLQKQGCKKFRDSGRRQWALVDRPAAQNAAKGKHGKYIWEATHREKEELSRKCISDPECDEYIRIFEYIGHEYIFGHSFVSTFLLRIYLDIRSCQICLYEYIRTFVGECVRV